ncbi:hypothetical protein HK100_007182, partial [Physocladia obscura]
MKPFAAYRIQCREIQVSPQHRPVLAKFPPEIISQVLKHIPIDRQAPKKVGMSSKKLFA